MFSKYFISGIGTDVGKTVVATILAEAGQADYWKPVQSGNQDGGDSNTVRKLISNQKTVIFPERYSLREPVSPHLAARMEATQIEASDFQLPLCQNHLIVEGAGGLMVPLNDDFLIIDLVKQFKLPMILVSANYLGSINHTLLSIKVIQQLDIPLKGIIFSGKENKETERVILHYSGVDLLGRIPFASVLNREFIAEQASFFSFLFKS